MYIPSFRVNLILSKKAQTEILAKKERVMVTAYVSGVPSTNIPKKYINRVEFGEFVLLSYPQNLSGSGVVEFKGMSFPKFFLPMLKNDDTSVLINIYTESKFSEFSLLD